MKKRIITGMIIGLFLCVIGIMCYSYNIVQSDYIDDEYRDINEYLSIKELSDGTIGIINKSTGKIVGRYDEVLSFYGMHTAATLIVVKDGLRGYISAETGESIFEPQFLYAWKSANDCNLAACVNIDAKMGFVNTETKKIAIPFQYNFEEDIFCPSKYRNNRMAVLDFVFSGGLCIVPGEDGKLGLIDTTGKLVLPIEYSDIINWRDANTPEIILKREISSGSYKYRICDRNFKPLLSIEYDSLEKIWGVGDEYEINMFGYIVSLNGLYGVLDNSFNIVLPIEYDDIQTSYMRDYKGMSCIVAVKNYVAKQYDSKGTMINDFYVECDYVYDEELDDYVKQSGLVSISDPFNGKASGYIRYSLKGLYGIIDGEKRVVIPAKYETIEYLGCGNFACIRDGVTFLKRDNK